MKRILFLISLFTALSFLFGCASHTEEKSVGMKKYCLENPPKIGTFEGLNVFEGGISGLAYIPETDMEFYLINDRGPNLVMTNHPKANGQNVKVFPFPDYAPKIFRATLENGVFRIKETLPIKKPDGSTVTGLPFPWNLEMNREIAWSDLEATPAGDDLWGIDAEGIAIGQNNDFWIVDEYRTSIWNIDRNSGKTKAIYAPEPVNEFYKPIDTIFKYRRPNRGFESVAITPSGLVYAILQSPMWNPGPEVSETSRLSRMLELNPITGETRTMFYEHADASGEVKIRDWKIADMVAINDHEFLILEHASRGATQFMDVYKIDISNATPIERENFDGKSAEMLNNAKGAARYGIKVVEKTHLLDIIQAGYDPELNKPEGLTIIDNQTIAIINDNDYDIDAPERDKKIVQHGHPTCLFIFKLPEAKRLNINTDIPE